MTKKKEAPKPTIHLRVEGRRGCGWRKPGAMYLICGEVMHPCCKLPIPMTVCPCCGEGIRPSRALRWLQEPQRLWAGKTCTDTVVGPRCPLGDGVNLGRMLLIWIGEKHYPTVGDFVREGIAMGISRRITSIPKGFEIGKTYVLLAHRRAIPAPPAAFGEEPGEPTPGIFSAFCPTAIEYVVKGDETDEELVALEKRGLTLVRIERIKEPGNNALPGMEKETGNGNKSSHRSA